MKIKLTLKEFISSWENLDSAIYKSIPKASYVEPDWDKRFADAGYYPVQIPNIYGKWTSIHAWCKKILGQEHYAWTGYIFWFEKEQDAILFSLKWSS